VSESTVELADAIEALRVGLTEALTRGLGHPMHFSLDPVELTVQAVVTKDAKGRIGWSLLGCGGRL
jgi:Trypsin-co-occurring domain 2